METLKLKDEINLKSFIDLKVNGILSLRKKNQKADGLIMLGLLRNFN